MGRFFCPVHGGHTDLGQTPLHFAVALGSAAAVKCLLKLCPDDQTRHKLLWERDSIGNNVFHICVRRNNTKMYDLLRVICLDLEKVLKKTDWWLVSDGKCRMQPPMTITDDDCLKNEEGRTPVELAAVEGNEEFIRHIIEKDKITSWSYGDLSLNMYLIRDFDSYKTVTYDRVPRKGCKYKSWTSKMMARINAWTQSRSSNETNVLQLLVDLKQKDLLDNLPIIRGILEHKYQTFGRHILIVWFFVVSCIFAVFEINVYLRNSGDSEADTYLPVSHPAAIVQVVIASSFLFVSFLYCVNQGLAPSVEVGHTGVAVQFQTHRVEEHLGCPIEDLIYAAQPFWLMRKFHADFLKMDAADKVKLAPNLLQKHKLLMELNRLGPTLERETKVKNSSAGDFGQQLLSTWNSTSKFAHCAMLIAKLLLHSIIGCCFTKPLQLWSVLVLVEKICVLSLEKDVAEMVSAALLSLASFAFFLSFLMFYRISDSLGPFMVLIKQMIVGDLMMWALVVVLFVVATAQAM